MGKSFTCYPMSLIMIEIKKYKLWSVKSTLLFSAILLFSMQVSRAQSLKIINTIALEEVKEVSIDRKGNLFYSDEKGNIKMLNRVGELIHSFSPQKTGQVSLIEAWPTLRVFVFYRDLQEYLFLDRFLASGPRYEFDNELIGFVSMATVSNDNGLWLLDDSDYTLKKLDLNFNEITVNSSLNTLFTSEKIAVNYMREYQNMLFLNDKNSGILVFDNYGNYIKKLPFTGLEYFSFKGDELYFLKQNTIHFYNLYNFQERKIDLPANKAYQYVFMAGNDITLLSEDTLEKYSVE